MIRRLFVPSFLLSACGDGGGFPDAPGPDSPPPTGTFSLAWTVTDEGGAPVTCDQIGAQTVTAVLRNPAVQGGSTEVFSCNTGMGTSPGIAPGNYQIDFELNGSTSTSPVIKTAPRQDIEIKSNQNTALMPLTFAVNATGNLALSLSALGVTAGNCETVANGGAGIDQFTITLEKTSDLSCSAVTFNVSAGAMGTAGTYVVNCATPATRACLYADQVLSVGNVASGSYRIHVRGRSGTDCYINDDVFSVPALGMTLTRTLNLAKTAVACP
ncbi:MAG: hypothetical protein ACKV2T_17850 [Kofleriaceae bacterium]